MPEYNDSSRIFIGSEDNFGQVMSSGEAAEYLKMHVKTVCRLAKEGKIPDPPPPTTKTGKTGARGKAVKVDISKLGPPPEGFAWTRTGRPVVETWPEEPLTCPDCGKEVSIKMGRFGPYVQRGEADDDEKKNASLLKGMEPHEIDLETALKLLSLPRNLGVHPENSEEVVAQSVFSVCL